MGLGTAGHPLADHNPISHADRCGTPLACDWGCPKLGIAYIQHAYASAAMLSGLANPARETYRNMGDKLQKELERDIRWETRREWARQHRKGLAIAAMMAVAMGIGAGITFLSGQGQAPDTDVVPPSKHGVAATFDGTEIPEDDVTAYIAQYRAYSGYGSDGDWATFMDGMSEEPKDVREDAIRTLARRIAVRNRAKELGIVASEEEVDKRIASTMKEAGIDEKWESYVTETLQYASTDDYRADIEMQVLLDKLLDVEIVSSEPSELDMTIYATNSGKSYTGYRTYDVLFPVDSDASASDVEAQHDAAESFAKDLKDNTSTDKFLEKAGDKAKDMGWSCLNDDLSASYAAALEDAEPGVVGTPFRDDDGWHVVWCAETFTTRPDTVLSLSQMPDEIYQALRVDTLHAMQSDSWTKYADELVEKGELVVNDMPTGLSYDVDMSLSMYRDDEDSDDESTDDGSAEDEDTPAETTEAAGE